MEKHDQLADIFASGVEGVEMVQVGKGTRWTGQKAIVKQKEIINLKKLAVSPILYPMTNLLSRVPSTSNTSITGPYLSSTFDITQESQK